MKVSKVRSKAKGSFTDNLLEGERSGTPPTKQLYCPTLSSGPSTTIQIFLHSPKIAFWKSKCHHGDGGPEDGKHIFYREALRGGKKLKEFRNERGLKIGHFVEQALIEEIGREEMI